MTHMLQLARNKTHPPHRYKHLIFSPSSSSSWESRVACVCVAEKSVSTLFMRLRPFFQLQSRTHTNCGYARVSTVCLFKENHRPHGLARFLFSFFGEKLCSRTPLSLHLRVTWLVWNQEFSILSEVRSRGKTRNV